MDTTDVTKYLDIASRRIYWIVLPFLFAVLCGMAIALMLPKKYEAQTLILVHEQRVPQNFVKPIVTSEVEERLRTISQQVLSRTNLEAIIKQHNFLAEKSVTMEEKVEAIRKAIKVEVLNRGPRGGNAFSVAYRASDPGQAMQIANALASNFISENLKSREEQALGTSDFLSSELETVKRRLAEKEDALQEYRTKHMGGMPEHLATNLTIVNRLQSQLEQIAKSLSDAENRKLIVQQQMAQASLAQKQMGELGNGASLVELDSSGDGTSFDSEELSALRRQLKSLETRYTPNHPDVVKIRKMIAKLESESAEAEKTESKPVSDPVQAPAFSLSPADYLKPQVEQVNLEIRNLRTEAQKLEQKIAEYQHMIENTPKREQELIALNRDYLNLKDLYNSLLDRKLEAEIAVSMEKKQKGEQFRVIDPAKLPERPVEPNVPRIILLSLIAGLGLGGGLAYFAEIMDTSYKSPDVIQKELKLPVLVSIPYQRTEQEMRGRKRREMLKAAGVAAGFAVCLVGIVVGTKGFGATIRYIKELAGL